MQLLVSYKSEESLCGTAKDAVIEAWNGDAAFANGFAALGWDTIMAAPYYLDAVGKQWGDFYGVNFPPNKNASIEAKMLGGEACM